MNDLPTTHISLLLRLSNRDDSFAWGEFTQIYSPVLKRVAASRGLRGLDADELVQEVLVKVMQHIQHFEHNSKVGSFRKWLLTIARNTTVSKLQRRPQEIRYRADSGELKLLTHPQDDSEQIASLLQQEWQSEMFVLACQSVRHRIQPLTWTAFWKTAVEGIDGETVAKEIGMSVGAVYVARCRTLAKLRAWVQENTDSWENQV